ncbi:YihY/virulence factor BrkB family protein [Pseudogemmobacter sonorensis]|uniref:YihY/virulence factor BrkB family protein n=1 Tax=Pseudogemmobacter sonorensis TaxID=2989681 RepID=UPI0036A24404
MLRILRSLWRFLLAVWTRTSDGHFGLIAAGVAFYAMFAVFPGLGAVVAIWGLMADPIVIAGYLEVVERFLPDDAAALVHDQVMALVNAPGLTLGWTTLLSMAVALYSARNGVSALVAGLDVVHRVERRNWLHGMAREFLLTFALIGALIVALATIVIVPVLLGYVQFGGLAQRLTRMLPWVAMFALVLSCLAILYRFGPNLPRGSHSGWITGGVIFAAFAWAGVSFGFSLYLENFNSYNRIYGSIGAVVILMMWLYLSVLAILTGGAINAELETRRQIRRQMGRRI